MINENELRINNWVYALKATPSPIQVSFNKDFEIWKTYDYDPIPITPKILEKCGFKKSLHPKLDKNCWSKNFGDLEFIISNKIFLDVYTKYNPSYEVRYFDYNFITTKKGINYVHQLQNLYFAITGKELEVKL
jgi:hypothetical protein